MTYHTIKKSGDNKRLIPRKLIAIVNTDNK